jgi:hypothetical protein
MVATLNKGVSVISQLNFVYDPLTGALVQVFMHRLFAVLDADGVTVLDTVANTPNITTNLTAAELTVINGILTKLKALP